MDEPEEEMPLLEDIQEEDEDLDTNFEELDDTIDEAGAEAGAATIDEPSMKKAVEGVKGDPVLQLAMGVTDPYWVMHDHCSRSAEASGVGECSWH